MVPGHSFPNGYCLTCAVATTVPPLSSSSGQSQDKTFFTEKYLVKCSGGRGGSVFIAIHLTDYLSFNMRSQAGQGDWVGEREEGAARLATGRFTPISLLQKQVYSALIT